jgi:hypothetical protein
VVTESFASEEAGVFQGEIVYGNYSQAQDGRGSEHFAQKPKNSGFSKILPMTFIFRL